MRKRSFEASATITSKNTAKATVMSSIGEAEGGVTEEAFVAVGVRHPIWSCRNARPAEDGEMNQHHVNGIAH